MTVAGRRWSRRDLESLPAIYCRQCPNGSCKSNSGSGQYCSNGSGYGGNSGYSSNRNSGFMSLPPV